MVHNGSESSFVSDVKLKKGLDLMLIELKETILQKYIDAFSQRGDGVVEYQGLLCVPMLSTCESKYYQKPIVLGIPFNRELPRCTLTCVQIINK